MLLCKMIISQLELGPRVDDLTDLTADVQKAKHGINHGTRFLEGDE